MVVARVVGVGMRGRREDRAGDVGGYACVRGGECQWGFYGWWSCRWVVLWLVVLWVLFLLLRVGGEVVMVSLYLMRMLLLRVNSVVVVVLRLVRLRLVVSVLGWQKHLERREALRRCGSRGFLMHLRNEPVCFAEAVLYGLVEGRYLRL